MKGERRASCITAGMEIGVFIPIGSNGWLVSTTSPQYKPSFELNKQTTLNAERYGLDFVLSMIKLRGFGGKSEFWDHNLESFTLMAGLAAVTSRIKLFATVPTLAVPPAICARMCSTIDSISNGRFGLNVITGWQIPEYSQMGLWPGDAYFGHRYKYATEYVRILRDLREQAAARFRTDVRAAVVGRPVRFVGAETEADNTYAEARLLEALRLARQRNHVQNRELLHYARLLRVENPMSPYLQAIE